MDLFDEDENRPILNLVARQDPADFFWSETRKRWEPKIGTKAMQWHADIVNAMKIDRSGFSDFVELSTIKAATPMAKRVQLGGHGSHQFTRGTIYQNFLVGGDDAKKTIGNKVVARRSLGINYATRHSRAVPRHIYKIIVARPSVISGSTKRIVADHKNGRYDKPSDRLDDYQPLTVSENASKREHCKRCRRTGLRFDATQVGARVSVVEGTKKYEGTCKGCYLFDPVEFGKSLINYHFLPI